jgi:hypothetical protein
MLGTKQSSRHIDEIFARLRRLPGQSCAQQFSCFFFERASMFGLARSQPVVSWGAGRLRLAATRSGLDGRGFPWRLASVRRLLCAASRT